MEEALPLEGAYEAKHRAPKVASGHVCKCAFSNDAYAFVTYVNCRLHTI